MLNSYLLPPPGIDHDASDAQPGAWHCTNGPAPTTSPGEVVSNISVWERNMRCGMLRHVKCDVLYDNVVCYGDARESLFSSSCPSVSLIITGPPTPKALAHESFLTADTYYCCALKPHVRQNHHCKYFNTLSCFHLQRARLTSVLFLCT